MSKSKTVHVRFRPERPIYLNEENLGVKTREEVDYAIERLRDAGWLCTYGEQHRPFHLSFESNFQETFNEFKKTAEDLDIKLLEPPTTPEEIALLNAKELVGEEIPGAKDLHSHDSLKGEAAVGASQKSGKKAKKK